MSLCTIRSELEFVLGTAFDKFEYHGEFVNARVVREFVFISVYNESMEEIPAVAVPLQGAPANIDGCMLIIEHVLSQEWGEDHLDEDEYYFDGTKTPEEQEVFLVHRS